MTFEDNPYYCPEKCGLETITSFELREQCYDFDTVVVWRHLETGRLYWAHDSGCSCPSPFEDVHSLGDMRELLKVDDFRTAVRGLRSRDGDDGAFYAADLNEACRLAAGFLEQQK